MFIYHELPPVADARLDYLFDQIDSDGSVVGEFSSR